MPSIGTLLHRWREQLPEAEALTPWVRGRLEAMFHRVPVAEEAWALEEELRSWAIRTGLYTPASAGELADAHLGMLAYYDAPASPAAVRRLIGMYWMWITSWDDGLIEKGTPVDGYATPVDRLLRRGEPPAQDTPSYRALAELRRGVVALGCEALLPEIADQVELEFAAWANERRWMACGELPALADYLPHHGLTMTTYVGMLLRRCGPGLLPAGTRFSPVLDHLAKRTTAMLGVQNDLVGVRADIERSYPLNTVTVIAHEYDLDLVTALRCAVTVLATEWHAVSRLADDLGTALGHDSAVHRQARAIVDFGHAFHTWHMTAPRFDPATPVIAPYADRGL